MDSENFYFDKDQNKNIETENDKASKEKNEGENIETEKEILIIEKARKLALNWAHWDNDVRGVDTEGQFPQQKYPEPKARLALPKNGKCLYVEEGNRKNNPVAFFNPDADFTRLRSIVFLPKNAPVGKDILVILENLEKKDKTGPVMYQGKPTNGHVEFWQDDENGSASLYRVHFNWKLEAEKENVESLDKKISLHTDKIIEKQFTMDNNDSVVNEEITHERIDISSGYPVHKQPGHKESYAHKILGFGSSISDWKDLFSVEHSPDEDVKILLRYNDKEEKTQQISLKWKDAPQWWKQMYEKEYPVCECGHYRFNVKKYAECENCRWKKKSETDDNENILKHYRSGELEIDDNGYYYFLAKRKIDEDSGKSQEDYLDFSTLEKGVHNKKFEPQKEITINISIPFKYEGRSFPPNIKMRRKLKLEDNTIDKNQATEKSESDEFTWENLKSCEDTDYIIEDVTKDVMTFLSFLTKRDSDFKNGNLELEIIDGAYADGGGNMYFDIKAGEKKLIGMFGKYGEEKEEWEIRSDLENTLEKGNFPHKITYMDKEFPIGSKIVITEGEHGESNTPSPEGEGWEKLKDLQFSGGSSTHTTVGRWETAWVKVPKTNPVKNKTI